MDTQTNQWTYLQPLIQDVLHQDQLLLPLLHLHLNSFYIETKTDRDKTSKHTNGHTNQPWTYLEPLTQDVLHKDQLLLLLFHLRLNSFYTETKTFTQRQRHLHRDTDIYTETKTFTQRQRHLHRDKDIYKETKTDRQKQTTKHTNGHTNQPWTYLQPLIQDVLHKDQLLLLLFHLRLNSFYMETKTDRQKQTSKHTNGHTNQPWTYLEPLIQDVLHKDQLLLLLFHLRLNSFYTETKTFTQRQRHLHRDTDIYTETKTFTQRQRHLHRDKDIYKETKTDRQKQTSKHTNGHTNQPWIYLQPLIQDVLHQDQLLLPLLHLRLKGLDEG